MRSPDPRVLALVVALAVVCASPSALPQNAEQQRLEGTLREKERLEREARERAAEQQRAEDAAGLREQQLRADRREAAQREQRHAGEIRRLEADIARLTQEEAAKRAALVRKAAERQRVLAALLRMAGNEPAYLVALPGDPLDNVQGALAFRAMEEELRRHSDLLAAALGDLRGVRESAEEARKRAGTERAALAAETERIERMLTESAEDQRRAAGERRKQTDLADRLRAEARDNEELIAALVKDREARERAERKAREEAERKAKAEEDEKAAARRQQTALPPPGISPPSAGPQASAPAAASERPKEPMLIAPARGAMLNPVAGRIVRQYGQTDVSGNASKGVVFEAGAKTRVVAPYDGQVVYAGPFRGYGRILIVEHGGGYHTLLSGLGRIDCAVGQWVVAGEPVAAMGEQSGAGLYVELRRDGQPVNPVPWLAAGNS